MSAPKKVPGKLGSNAGRKLIALVAYCRLAQAQAPFGYVSWLIEQRKARLADEVKRRRT